MDEKGRGGGGVIRKGCKEYLEKKKCSLKRGGGVLAGSGTKGGKGKD